MKKIKMLSATLTVVKEALERDLAEYRKKLKDLSHSLTLIFKPVILIPRRRIKKMEVVST